MQFELTFAVVFIRWIGLRKRTYTAEYSGSKVARGSRRSEKEPLEANSARHAPQAECDHIAYREHIPTDFLLLALFPYYYYFKKKHFEVISTYNPPAHRTLLSEPYKSVSYPGSNRETARDMCIPYIPF